MMENRKNCIQTDEEHAVLPTVDYVECGTNWVRGYKDEVCVVTFTEVADISKILLYNENGEPITPVPAPLTETEQLQMAITELTMLMGGMLSV